MTGSLLARTAGATGVRKIWDKIHYFGRWGRSVDGTIERLPENRWREDFWSSRSNAMTSAPAESLAHNPKALPSLMSEPLPHNQG